MGKPSSALDKHGYAEIIRDGPVFTHAPTKDDPNPQAQPLDAEHEEKFDNDPEVATSKVWRYYGHGDRDQYAAIYFKEDRVIGIAHGMTQEMVRSDLFK